ncbi:adenine phosphoribosyltransferase [Haloarchaeobius amylolyticus]|uniref:adenine phosphoribosyltransferase n=1 Tax=Haloarchaeobius amylolyticus TaxID=1198296 RepID=UPI00226D4CEA|nr:adenine phosphoribosyltransferase [Haloarchaeobius amylolyticus]
MDALRRSIHEAPLIEDDGYHYLVHPISNGIPTLDPHLMREVVNGICRVADLADVDVIVTPVTMGVHVSTAVSLVADIPLVVIRNREYGFDDEVPFDLDGEEYYVNDVSPDDNVLVLDDLTNTGVSIAAITEALDDIGATVVDVVTVIRRMESETVPMDYEVTSLVDVEVSAEGVEILD